MKLIVGPIEDGVPPPKPKRRWSFILDLEVGQSRLVEGIDGNRGSGYMTEIARKHNRQFTCRTVMKDGVRCIRVWRIR